MDSSTIAAIITAGAGGLVGVLGVYKAYRSEKSSQDSARSALEVQNFQILYNQQEKNYTALVAEVTRLKDEQQAEREIWHSERQQWAKERAYLTQRIEEVSLESSQKDKTIGELKAQVLELSNQLNAYKKLKG